MIRFEEHIAMPNRLISCLTLVLVLGFTGKINAQITFSDLDDALHLRDSFQQVKEQRIQSLRSQFLSERGEHSALGEETMVRLHEAYFTYDFDSAMYYTSLIHTWADQAGLQDWKALAKIKQSSTLLSSGMFSEARDTLQSIAKTHLPDSLYSDYFYCMARSYLDMADFYNKPNYTNRFTLLGIQYLDSAIQYVEVGSIDSYSLIGLKAVKMQDFRVAIRTFQELFERYSLEGRQLAIDASTYAFALRMAGFEQEEISWLIRAAIADIQIVNREYVALRLLANRLYELGQVDQASHYLNIALADAQQYGASQRERQIAQIQPLVEAERLSLIQQQRNRLRLYSIGLAALSVLSIALAMLLYRQLRNVRNARDEVNRSNHALREINQQLREANLIKEEYFAYFFRTNSDLIDTLDDYRITIDQKVRQADYQALISLITKRDIMKERKKLLKLFDEAFLNIFPSFVSHYNALFESKGQQLDPDKKELNTDARIFALIRLGLGNVETIAQILGYSVNTINTYKTKVKNMAIIPNEEFEPSILRVQSL